MKRYHPDFPPVALLSPLEPFSAPQQNVYGLGRDAQAEFVRPVDIPRQPETAVIGDVQKVSNAQQFAYVISQTVNCDNVTSIKFLDQSSVARNMLAFRNLSATVGIYIDFGGPASASSWVYLTPGQTSVILFDNVVPQDDLYCLASAPGGSFVVAYSTFNPKL